MIKDTINDGRKNDPYWHRVVIIGGIASIIFYLITYSFGASIVFSIGVLILDHFLNFRKRKE